MGRPEERKRLLSEKEIEFLSINTPKCKALFDQIIQFDGKLKHFQDWAETVYPDFKGFRSGGTINFKNQIFDFNGSDFHSLGLVFTNSSYATLKGKMEWFQKKAEEYIIYTGLGTTWWLYFLHVDGRYEPKLGRAKLELVSKTQAKLKNVKHASSEDYEGLFEYVNRDIYNFDLRSTPSRDRKIHIKFYWKNGVNKIALGSYITYEDNHIVTGTLVVERFTSNSEDGQDPAFLTFKEKPEQFANLKGIADYLSVKAINYRKLPTKIADTQQLIAQQKKPIKRLNPSRFLETKIPTVFIASPDTSKNPSAGRGKIVMDVINRLKKEFKDHYEINHKIIDLSPHAQKNITPLDTFRSLQRTRVFILIIAETHKASFSLVQLGAAIIYTKFVYVFYKEGCLSKRMESLNQLGVTLVPISDINSDLYDKIAQYLAISKLT